MLIQHMQLLSVLHLLTSVMMPALLPVLLLS
jgi:hypothetical protein